MYHLLQAFGERFEQRDSKTARSGLGLGLGGSGSVASRNSALLLPNWFEDAAEYRLKKALVSSWFRRGKHPETNYSIDDTTQSRMLGWEMMLHLVSAPPPKEGYDTVWCCWVLTLE